MSKQESNEQSSGSGWMLAGGLLLGGAAAALGYAIGRNTVEEQPQRQCSNTTTMRQPRQQSRDYQDKVVKCDKCAICLQDMDIIVLPCKHAFDESCIKPWLDANGTCPICRAPVK